MIIDIYIYIYTHTLLMYCIFFDFFSEPLFHANGVKHVISNYYVALCHVKGFHNHFGIVCFPIGFHLV